MFFTTSPAYTIFIRLKLRNRSGIMSRIISVIRRLGGEVRGVTVVDRSREWFIRDVHVNVVDGTHARRIVDELSNMEGVVVESISDRTFMAHLGGKIEVVSKRRIATSEDLSRVYTPGVGRVAEAIRNFPDTVFTHTIKSNTVAIVTDGSAVLGFGNIGALAAIPVMEGKAAILKEFGGVNGFPICLATQEPGKIIELVKMISPVFGAVNLEDIAAPKCFEIEKRLQEELEIPVMHDDQHATAVAVLASLINALKIVGKNLFDIKIVINGIGAAGYATSKLLLKVGVRNMILCDKKGAIGRNGENSLNEYQAEIAQYTNPDNFTGDLKGSLKGADVFIGLSVGGILKAEDIKVMARDPIVFALANPIPEIFPEEASEYAKIVATGRSDYPNQINNALVYPGFFKGLLACGAKKVVDDMKIAAAYALASLIDDSELYEENIIPSVFDTRVVEAVSSAVQTIAIREELTREIKPIKKILDI